jgi:outer membrane protein OmpA-like peptidoglycan-associated protein
MQHIAWKEAFMAEDWLADVRKYVADADETVVKAIVRYCGIALQNRDSSLVAFSDTKETERVRENYLKKKLGLTNSDAELDGAIAAVGDRMKEDRTKNRVTVYYLLAEHFGLLTVFGGSSASAAPLAAAAGLGAAAVAGTAATAAAAEPVVTAPPPAPEPAPAAAAPTYAASSFEDEDTGGGGLGWLKWLLLAALLALMLFFLMRSCSPQGTAPVDDGMTTEATGGEAADAAAGDAAATAAIPEGAGVVAADVDGKPKLTVYFDSGKSDVTNDLAAAAAKVKAYIEANPTAKLAVSGYNDPTGNAAVNAEISKKRAQGVGKALEAVGIPATVIDLVKPSDTTDASGDNTAARRVEVTVQ